MPSAAVAGTPTSTHPYASAAMYMNGTIGTGTNINTTTAPSTPTVNNPNGANGLNPLSNSLRNDPTATTNLSHMHTGSQPQMRTPSNQYKPLPTPQPSSPTPSEREHQQAQANVHIQQQAQNMQKRMYMPQDGMRVDPRVSAEGRQAMQRGLEMDRRSDKRGFFASCCR